jgi:hypothetical protein
MPTDRSDRVVLQARTSKDKRVPPAEHTLTVQQFRTLVTFAGRTPISDELLPRLVGGFQEFTSAQMNGLRQFLTDARGPVTFLEHGSRRVISPAEAYGMRYVEGAPPPGVPEPQDVTLIMNGFTGEMMAYAGGTNVYRPCQAVLSIDYRAHEGSLTIVSMSGELKIYHKVQQP